MSTATVTLDDLIEKHDTGDPDSTAEAVFDAIKLPAKFRGLLHGVVRDECRRWRRQRFILDITTITTDLACQHADELAA